MKKFIEKSKCLRKTLLAYLLSVSLIFSLGMTAMAEEAGSSERDYTGWDTLKVFETTDVHGYITDVSTYKEETFQYRLAYIANIVNKARAEMGEENVILLDSGDIYQSTPHSNLTYGNYMRAAFDVMGYDALGLGNHEFDWDVTKYAADADGTMSSYETTKTGEVDPTIPVVMANLYYAGTSDRVNFTKDYVVVQKGDYKVAIVGWTDEYTADIKASQIEPYDIDDNVEHLNALVETVEETETPDIMIVLTHGAPDTLAAQVDADLVDLVCGGHTHLRTCGTASNGVDYIQGNCKAQGYATAEIKINPETKEVDVISPKYTWITSTTDNSHLYYKDGTNAELDGEIVEISQEAWDAVKDNMYEVLATVDEDITKEVLDGGIVISSAGKWLTGLMMDATKEYNTVAAFANSGGIRTSLIKEAGAETRDITIADVYTISPFGNRILTYAITGQQMAQQIENTIRFETETSNATVYNYTNFGDQFSGISVTFERVGTGIKVLSIVTDDGQVIDVNDNTKTYNVAVNEYCATLTYDGIDSVFKNLTPLAAMDEAPVDNESAIAALRERREAEGLEMKLDTTACLKVDTGEAAASTQMSQLLETAEQFNANNVTAANKAELQQLVNDMKALIDGGKLTDAQVVVMEKQIADMETLIGRLNTTDDNKTDNKVDQNTGNNKADKNESTNAVKTGDAANVMPWIAVMGICGAVVVMNAERAKRKENN